MADASSAINATNPIGLAAEGLGIIEGGIQLFSNLNKEKKARQALSQLRDPFYKIQDEYYQNRDIAANEAQSGLPAATKDYYTSEIQRGLGAGISGQIQSGGSPNDITKLFDVYSRSIDRTAAEDAAIHAKNVQYYMDTNRDLAGQKNIQFGFNEVRPYERKYARLTQEKAAAEENAYGGANTIIGSASALGTSLGNNALLNNLFKDDGKPFKKFIQ